VLCEHLNKSVGPRVPIPNRDSQHVRLERAAQFCLRTPCEPSLLLRAEDGSRSGFMQLAQTILIVAVRFYRWIFSPAKDALFGPSAQCRFEPSCSAYAVEALEAHGACKGTWLALKRLGRCHPWGPFGADPVPPKRPARAAAHPAITAGPRAEDGSRSGDGKANTLVAVSSCTSGTADYI